MGVEILMKSKLWWCVNFIILLGSLFAIMFCVYRVDPYFHYHEPQVEKYYYKLSIERAQNNGVVKNFDYDALITGASSSECFKTSEMDTLFNTKSVKVSYAGGSFKEVNDNLSVAFENNEHIKTVIRALEMQYFFDESNRVWDYAHKYEYLYDDNWINDINYLFEGQAVERTCAMMLKHIMRKYGGITSFDEYANWSKNGKYGVKTVCSSILLQNNLDTKYAHLTDEDRSIINDNVSKNLTSIADQYPEVDFYYFIAPFSAVWWNEQMSNGNIYRQIEAEAYIIQLLLKHENIHLYSFNNITHITTDLNNYKDNTHYGEWVNSFMLKAMHDGEYKLTKNNYKEYIEQELLLYTTYDYEQLNNQEDYEDDYKAAEMLANWKGTGRAEDLN